MTDQLQRAIAAVNSGDKKAGYRLLAQIIEASPRSKDAEQAWLWMSLVVDDPQRKRQCIETALAINPNNAAAKRKIAELDTNTESPELPQTKPLSQPVLAQNPRRKSNTTTKQPESQAYTLKYYGPTPPDEYVQRFHNYLGQLQSVSQQMQSLGSQYTSGQDQRSAEEFLATHKKYEEQLRQILYRVNHDIDAIRFEYQRLAEQLPASEREQLHADRSTMLKPFEEVKVVLDKWLTQIK